MGLLDEPTWRGRVFTGGWTSSSGGDTPVVEPATGAELGRTGIADASDVAASAAVAAKAQRDWADTPFQERAAVLRRAGDLWREHADEIGQWLQRGAGNVRAKVGFELHVAQQECYEAAALPSRPLGELLPSEQPRLSMARRVPVGLVGSSRRSTRRSSCPSARWRPLWRWATRCCSSRIRARRSAAGSRWRGCSRKRACRRGVLHVLPGGVEAGKALVTDPRVRVISFTGSTAAGRRVGELAGRHLKRAHLELGGNSALVVLADVDLDRAASAGAFGSFFHQGQICMTTGRHLVHRSVVDEYAALLGAKADRLRVGDTTSEQVELGPVIDERQRDKVHGIVTSSVDGGARVVAGGTFEGLFYRPTVLADVAPDAPASALEVFGPVASITAFATLDEVAELAAGSEYGLSLGVLTGDVMKGLALAERVPTGIVHINDQTVNDEAHAPFGGVRDSGTGARFGGAAANVDAFTETRWVTVRSDVAPSPY